MAITKEDVLQTLKDAGIKRAVLDKLDPKAPLMAQGFDSLDLAIIGTAVERAYGLPLTKLLSARVQSLDDMVVHLNKE